MKWEVAGADRTSGQDRKVIVEADTEESARRRANRENLMVSDLRALDANDSAIRPAIATSTVPPIKPDDESERELYRTTLHPVVIFVVQALLCVMIGIVVVFGVTTYRNLVIDRGPPAILQPSELSITCVVIGLVMLPFAYLRYHFTSFVITNKRISIRQGWLSQRSFEMLLPQVESIHAKTTILGRLIGCGTVLIHGTGGSNEVFPGIRNAAEFRRQATDAIERYARR